jgi:hypothetical protein
VKTTLDLPDELIREVKLRAVIQGRTVKDLVSEFIRKGLGLTQAQPEIAEPGSIIQIGEDGLPTIQCSPTAPATQMSTKNVLELERDAQSEEDSQRAGKPV